VSEKLVSKLRRAGVLGYTKQEIMFIYETMDTLQPDFLCEWGTNVGHSARIFHEARAALGLDCELHSVDSLEEPPILRSADAGRSRGSMVAGLPVKLHVGDGAVTAIALYGRSRALHPLFFLDSNHEEAEVYCHLSLIATEVPEATMLVHDVSFARNGEPERALRRFLDDHEGEYETDEVPEGQSLIRLRPCR
jgi:cephalosporin hydroxylase